MINKIRDEWNAKIGVPMNTKPTLIHIDQGMIMAKLFYDEYIEYNDACSMDHGDARTIAIADAIGDMTYLLYGTVAQYGLVDNHWFKNSKKPVQVESINFHINELMINIRKNLMQSIISTLENLDILLSKLWDKHDLSDHVDAVMNEIHRSNLTKIVEGVIYMKKNGKVMKPKTFEEPDLSFVLNNN